jgi:hypothetical protein
MLSQSPLHKYGFVWVTLLFFLGSLMLHFLYGWYAYVDEQTQFGFPIDVQGYSHEMLRDIFENWQSEFLQLIWQVLGLAYLLYAGSPQSKEGDDRKEEKLDALLRMMDKQEGEKVIRELDNRYGRA